MIQGFEFYTSEINKEEYGLMKQFLDGFKNHIGKSKAISSTEIIRLYKTKLDIQLSDSRIRKIIHVIRKFDLDSAKFGGKLISSSIGYWIETDRQEIMKYVEGFIGRRNSLNEIISTFQIYLG